ncbi:hypothetical protein BDY21DRAFT_355658 [Lineolata rhizophorae]|uniref:DUF1308 domain-containing protein n=1 Tax=Lineolata rhizophorae TaxID=578093 RepID=A0A6A6NPP8_9PEZI|nr:hypothetical protein BDY21DRAFT_355658 [Lineolata rhizophorae]
MASPSVADLVERAKRLLTEVEAFEKSVIQQRRENAIEHRHFVGSIRAEVRSLEKLSSADPSSDRIQHTVNSSNLPFFESVWAAAKRTTGIVAFTKRFYWTPTTSNLAKRATKDPKRHSALVDVVAKNGSEWIKVSTITKMRLLFEMAKQGWANGPLSDSGEEDDTDCPKFQHPDDEDNNEISLVKAAENLRKASQATRVRYHHPKVHFVLPKIEAGEIEEVDRILEDIQNTGATLHCGSQIPQTLPELDGVLSGMVFDEFRDFSDVLNIDCTVLLALVSDLSHYTVPQEQWLHKAVRRQIEMEDKEKLLPTSLYPAMGGRKLVTTAEAAKRMHEIVDTIGTETEKARTAIIMQQEPRAQREELIERFQKYSDYPVPSSWQIPLKIVNKDVNRAQVPSLAEAVMEPLSDINRSVFSYGWLSGRTTISSNRTVAKQIEHLVEEHRTSEEDRGPDVWLCPTARSLVGKEKGRKE